MAITNESQFIVESLIDLTDSMNSKCNQYSAYSLCFYLFRSCELHNVSDPDSGSQLPICRNKCEGFDKLFQECTDKEKLQIAADTTQSKVLHNFVTSSERFMCSDPNTYIIPQIPVSNTSCDDVSYIDSLLPNEGS